MRERERGGEKKKRSQAEAGGGGRKKTRLPLLFNLASRFHPLSSLFLSHLSQHMLRYMRAGAPRIGIRGRSGADEASKEEERKKIEKVDSLKSSPGETPGQRRR